VIQPTGEATGFIPAPGNHGKPITGRGYLEMTGYDKDFERLIGK